MAFVAHVIVRIGAAELSHIPCEIQIVNTANPYKALRVAIETGDTQTTIGLLDSGLTVSDYHFRIAVEKKHYGILELLLSRGDDINTDVNGTVSSTLV